MVAYPEPMIFRAAAMLLHPGATGFILLLLIPHPGIIAPGAFMDTYVYLWQLWTLMGTYGHLWTHMDIDGHLCTLRTLWSLIDTYGHSCTLMHTCVHLSVHKCQ